MDTIEGLKAIDEKLDGMKAARIESEKAITEKLAALSKDVLDLQQAGVKAAAETKAVESLGAQFVKSAGYADMVSGRSRSVRFEKAVVAGTLPAAQRVSKIGTAVGFAMLGVEDLLPAKPASSNMIEFVQEKAWTNSAAAVLEAGQKPESTIEFEVIQAPVQTIAHFARVTRQFLADAAAMAAFLDTRMEDGLANSAESEFVTGSGTAPHLKGLMAAGNYIPHGLTKGTGETNLDLIRKSAVAVRISGFKPNAVILNPTDYDAIIGLKTTEGAYLMANPVSENAPTLWGMRVVQSSAVSAGQYLVGDFAQADVYNRQQPVVEVFEQDADNVTKNLVTVRAERRAALAVYSPMAFVGGALW